MFSHRSLSRLPPSTEAAALLRRHFSTSRRPFRSLSTTAQCPSRTREIRKSSFESTTLRVCWYAMVVALGALGGGLLRGFVAARLGPPLPGTQEDDIALEALADQMDQLDIVKKMRAQGYNLHSNTPLVERGNGKGGWMELDIKENMTETATDMNRSTRTLTQKALAGIQGLGVQRAFWNSETRELVAVVWIGPRLSGWPGVVHGGAIATIFEDAMSRMIAGPSVPIDSIPTPTSMSVTYTRPSMSFNFFILRATFSKPELAQDVPPPEDLTKKWTTAGPEPAMEISATLESLEGEVKARAKGTWPASAVIKGNA